MLPHPTPNRRHVLATQVAGLLISVVGIAVIVFALVNVSAVGIYPQWNEEAGYLLIAIAGFLVSAAGTDLRHNARRASR